MNKYKNSKCPVCSSIIKLHRHNLSKGLVDILRKMPRSVDFEISKIGLTHSEITNAHKLKYWNFIEKREKYYWRVTTDAIDFISGKLQVPGVVYTIKGKINHVSELCISVNDVYCEINNRDYYVENSKQIIHDSEKSGRLF